MLIASHKLNSNKHMSFIARITFHVCYVYIRNTHRVQLVRSKFKQEMGRFQIITVLVLLSVKANALTFCSLTQSFNDSMCADNSTQYCTHGSSIDTMEGNAELHAIENYFSVHCNKWFIVGWPTHFIRKPPFWCDDHTRQYYDFYVNHVRKSTANTNCVRRQCHNENHIDYASMVGIWFEIVAGVWVVSYVVSLCVVKCAPRTYGVSIRIGRVCLFLAIIVACHIVYTRFRVVQVCIPLFYLVLIDCISMICIYISM
jgi:hypothetical protein